MRSQQERRWSGLIEPRRDYLSIILSIVFGGHQTSLITCPTPPVLQWSRVDASCCGGVFQQLGQREKSLERLNGAKLLTKTWNGDLRMGVTLAAKTSQERFRDNSVNVPQRTSQSPEPCWTSVRKDPKFFFHILNYRSVREKVEIFVFLSIGIMAPHNTM